MYKSNWINSKRNLAFMLYYCPATVLWEGNIFSHLSVILSVHRGFPMWPLPMMHWTLSEMGPLWPPPPSWPPPPRASDMGPPQPQPPASDIWWPSLEPPTGTDVWWFGHRRTNGWQAGGRHPTEMLSCFCLQLQIIPTLNLRSLQSIAQKWGDRHGSWELWPLEPQNNWSYKSLH